MMTNILFSRLITIVVYLTIKMSFAQSETDFNYLSISQDEFNAIKYENEKKSKELISNKFDIPISFLKLDSLSIREKIEVRALIGSVKIFKFYDSNTLLLMDGYLRDINLIDDPLLQVLYALDLEAFLAFYSSKPDENFPEVNILKLKVKNDKNDLIIEKLAKVLKENKAVLSKYLD